MVQNLRLVKYFTSEFYRSHTHNLAHIASPSFVFQVNGGEEKDFEAYAERSTQVSKTSHIEFEDFVSDDDVVFRAKFIVTTKKGNEATGVASFTVLKGLLQKVCIDYDDQTEQFLEFQAEILSKAIEDDDLTYRDISDRHLA